MSSISEKMATDFAIVNSKLEILEEVNHGVIGNLVRASISVALVDSHVILNSYHFRLK